MDDETRAEPFCDRVNVVGPFSLEQLVHRAGGVTTRAALIELTSRAEVDRALREGRIVGVARGRYALPMANAARRAAAGLHGVVSHRSAAAYWGWGLKNPPREPCVTVDRDRSIASPRRKGVALSWSRLQPGDVVDGWVTSPERTFVDCCRTLPFDEALALADSARRQGTLSRKQMILAAEGMGGPGRPVALRVARAATHKAENPFESVLRAIALDVPHLHVEPQVLLIEKPFTVRPDLVDEALRLALEADSFEWHGSRSALTRDCRRYNLLTIHGWHVLRFSWEDVMLHADDVRDTLQAFVAAVRRPAQARRTAS